VVNVPTVTGALRALDGLGQAATDADARVIATMIHDFRIITTPVTAEADPPPYMPAPVAGRG
jgi:hypothetical protein